MPVMLTRALSTRTRRRPSDTSPTTSNDLLVATQMIQTTGRTSAKSEMKRKCKIITQNIYDSEKKLHVSKYQSTSLYKWPVTHNRRDGLYFVNRTHKNLSRTVKLKDND